MKVPSAGCWMLRGSVVFAAMFLVGCKTEDNSATPWEILHGTSSLAASKAVSDTTFLEFVSYSGRSGVLTVGDDSTIHGWIRYTPADSQHQFTGTVRFGTGDPIMALAGVMPWKYRVITSPGFPDTYAVISDTVLTANLVGDAALEKYRLYWEFHR